MTIRTKEQLTQDLETLAAEEHHPNVFRASERIRMHLAAIPAALSLPLTTDEAPHCFCPGEDCEMGADAAVCPVAEKVARHILPALLKRIGVE